MFQTTNRIHMLCFSDLYFQQFVPILAQQLEPNASALLGGSSHLVSGL